MELGEDGLPQIADLFEETADDDKDIIDKRIKEHTKLRVKNVCSHRSLALWPRLAFAPWFPAPVSLLVARDS